MSDAATGQPVEVPAESPATPTAPTETTIPVTTGDAGDPSPGTGADGGGLIEAPGGEEPPGQNVGGSPGRRRRGSRGGRGRARAGSPATSNAAGGPSEPAEPAGTDGPAAPLSVVTSSAATPTAAERPRIGDTRPARPPSPDTGPGPAPGSGPGKRGSAEVRRPASPGPARNPARSGGGGRSRQRGGSGDGATPVRPEQVTTGTEPRAEGRRGGRERRGKAVGRYMICVHVRPEMTQIALLEGRTLVEHYISRASDDATQIDGNIYQGRVQNVLPGMEAAFIDIGTPKNAVLYHGDVRYDTEDVESGSSAGQPRIEQLLRPGQTILCQVTKNPIGAKGARLTQEVSLPGRFVVLVPNSSAYGISKRLDDSERKRLRRIVDAIRPDGHGLIVRTAAAGASAEELGNDVERLVAEWETIAAAATRGQGPALLYREPAIAVRVIREELNREYRAVVIDDLTLYEQVRDYVGAVNPELADRVEYFDPAAEALPVFERYHVHEQLHKALDRKVYLPSGGSLVIDRTEALTVIDVNTGKNVGTTNLEETVYRNNLEAAEEVARQLRLRDIGGIIVIDFIDMEVRENRDKVGSALRSALARDKTRTQVFDISELGLVEMTRKRISEGLIESMSSTCEVCNGRGIVFDDPEL
jgi:ribonuclease E